MTCSSKSKKSIDYIAQSSVEQLIVLGAFLAVFSALLPPMIQSYQATLFLVEVSQAQQSLQRMQNAVDSMELMASDSTQSIELVAPSDWLLECDGKTISITLQNKFLNKTKKLQLSVSQPIPFFQKTISGKTTIAVRKTTAGVSMQ